MSFDFSMRIDVGGEYPADVGGERNFTYNIAPMYYKAFPHIHNDEGEEGIRAFNGMLGSDAIPLLRAGIADMEANIEEYEKLNPANGWGSYDGAVSVLQHILKWCLECPKASISIH